MWQQLIVLLGDLTKQYDILLKLAAKKHTALVTVDFQTVDLVRKAEEKTIAAIDGLEKRRLELLAFLADAEGSQEISPEINRRDLYRLAPEEVKKELLTAGNELSAKVEAVKEASDNNTLLLKSALQAVTYKLNRLSKTSVDQSYGPGGSESVTAHRKSLDFGA
ncbi:MAG: flagellar export chaperone FlgN [Schwartzia sp.]|nr:flagellar export chaperone FlgN [Schwartzia sp. (in: firmicutes)]